MRHEPANHAERSARLSLEGLDLDAFHARPLDGATLRCLRYMHDVEHHTACYLRDLLVTPAHRDPELTAFLTSWAYEEHWHGEAIARVLAAHDESAGDARVGELRARSRARDGWRPVLHLVASRLVGEDYTAVQMTWGALNEWTTQAGYARLAARAEHPVLAELLRRIMRQEGRHIAFYAAQARRRLASSSRARRVARLALQRFWGPVGSDVMPPAEVAFLVGHLFDGPEGRAAAARVDRQLDRFEGLGGLALVSRAVDRLAGEAALAA